MPTDETEFTPISREALRVLTRLRRGKGITRGLSSMRARADASGNRRVVCDAVENAPETIRSSEKGE